MKNFEKLKEKIFTAAKAARACTDEYKKAYSAENMLKLCNVIKGNFYWCCDHGVLTPELIESYKAYFSTNGIYHNENVSGAYLLASGSSTVKAYGSSYINSYSSIECKIYNKAVLRHKGIVTYCGQTISVNV